jgi:GMP synthase (glutamine-hydrolysing)
VKKTALVVTHVAFEDPGSLLGVLVDLGFEIETIDACTADFDALAADHGDLAFILGGPIGVYEREAYPFLNGELGWIKRRIAADKPLAGICLGAQLIAVAMGAEVYPGENGKEIGWLPVMSASGAHLYPEWRDLLAAGAPVLHWHGDTFDLPLGVDHIARSEQYPHQAFARGPRLLGIQFHIEATAQGLERWYVGHACELAKTGIEVAALRRQSHRLAPALEALSRRFWRAWIEAALRA